MSGLVVDKIIRAANLHNEYVTAEVRAAIEAVWQQETQKLSDEIAELQDTVIRLSGECKQWRESSGALQRMLDSWSGGAR